uniref:Uncharacterized protein n=1 Tax=Aplanochytrium stocchinoi TaxID=215587 RepID=A0A7S3LQR7_9STRA
MENSVISYLKRAQLTKKLETLSRVENQMENANDVEKRAVGFIELVGQFRRDGNEATGDNLESVVSERINSIALELRDGLCNKLKKAVAQLEWPLTANRRKLNMSSSVVAHVKSLFEHIASLQLIYLRNKSVANIDETEIEDDIWGLEAFVEPIVKRFRYHFGGNRKTNRVDKPEWFVSFISDMIKDHSPIIVEILQPVAEIVCASIDTEIRYFFDLLSQFVRSLIRKCIHWRLDKSYKVLESSDALMCHTIDQILPVDNQLRGIYGYAADLGASKHKHSAWPSMIDFFADDEKRRQRWVRADFLNAYKRIETIISEDGAWQTPRNAKPKHSLTKTKASETVGCVPESCNEMLNLVKKISNRFSKLLTPEQSFPFVSNIQLPILNTYRLAVFNQLIEPAKNIKRDPLFHKETIRMLCVGANALLHIGIVLEEWAGEFVYSSIREYQLSTETLSETSRMAILGKSRHIMKNIQTSITDSKYKRDLLKNVVPSVLGRLWRNDKPQSNTVTDSEPTKEHNEDIGNTIEMKPDARGGVFASEVYQLDLVYNKAIKKLADITVFSFRAETSLVLSKTREQLKHHENENGGPAFIFPQRVLKSLSLSLSMFEDQLHPVAVNSVVKNIANGISEFVLSAIIENQVFSEEGAKLLERECQSLYRPFLAFSKRPENRYFRDLKVILQLYLCYKNTTANPCFVLFYIGPCDPPCSSEEFSNVSGFCSTKLI